MCIKEAQEAFSRSIESHVLVATVFPASTLPLPDTGSWEDVVFTGEVIVLKCEF